VVDKNLVIDGASLSSHVKVSPLNSRGFYITSGVTATLRDLDIIKGSTTESGGGIYNAGTLTVENCTIAANSALSSGGGIYNTGDLTVSASTVSGNTATGNIGESGSSGGGSGSTGGTGSKGEDGRGGGIFNSGVLELTNVTLEGNQAKGGQGGDGGNSNGARGYTGATGSTGYYAYCPQHQACRGGTGSRGGMGGRGGDGGIGGTGGMGGDGLGGGIYNSGNITMVNVTLMNNQVFSGSGGEGGSALAGPGGYGGHGGLGGGCTCSEYPCSCSTGQQGSQGSPGFPGSPGIWGSDGSTGATISGGVYNTGILNLKNTILATSLSGVDCYNASGTLAVLIRNLIESNGAGANACGSPAVTVNPILGPLANNGGLTQTMALLPGSPAIDAGDNATCARTDQRGVVRPQGVACDIGAFELEDITSNARIYLPLVIR
jgi:hypothetical protein